jgi:hypothetical protein
MGTNRGQTGDRKVRNRFRHEFIFINIFCSDDLSNPCHYSFSSFHAIHPGILYVISRQNDVIPDPPGPSIKTPHPTLYADQRPWDLPFSALDRTLTHTANHLGHYKAILALRHLEPDKDEDGNPIDTTSQLILEAITTVASLAIRKGLILDRWLNVTDVTARGG